MNLTHYKNEAQIILQQMTNEEKVLLLQGKDFWHTNPIDRLNIKELMMTDGPYGLRKQVSAADHVGLNQSKEAVCYPTGSLAANTFNPDLLNKMGQELAKECIKENISMILGPAINHKRLVNCGRNFEYFSEDPYLSGKLAAGFIQGVEQYNISTCLKHFACNNQEALRLVSDSVVDERALFEIYLKAFKIAVEEGKPSGIMTAYNKINGTYLSNHKELLEDTVRNKWGFDGLFVTDWGAIDDLVLSFKNGLDLEMPGLSKGTSDIVLKALNEGLIDQEKLDEIILRHLEFNLRAQDVKEVSFNLDQALELSKEIALEGSVLLKNEDHILPFNSNTKLGVVGLFAKEPRFEGGGSSKVNPIVKTCLYDELKAHQINFDYADGYDQNGNTTDSLILEATTIAKRVDQVLVLAGLPDIYESESYDRENIKLPLGHLRLIEEVAKVNPNVVVLLNAGSIIELPFEKDVKAILHGFLGGGMGAQASYELLFGLVSPSGKLSESYPLKMEDSPAFNYYERHSRLAEYRESIFTGYRYYESANQKVLYPFGYGLSYSEFKYSNLKVASSLQKNEALKLEFDLENSGNFNAKEIVQIYLSKKDSKIPRPLKELKEFIKVELLKGEKKRIELNLPYDAFSYYDTDLHDYAVEEGTYTLMIAKNVQDVQLEMDIEVEGISPTVQVPEIYFDPNKIKDLSRSDFETLCGFEIKEEIPQKPYDQNVTLADLEKSSFLFRQMIPLIKSYANKAVDDEMTKKMMESMLIEMPIRSLGLNGDFTKYGTQGLVEIINGHPIKGAKLFKKEVKIK